MVKKWVMFLFLDLDYNTVGMILVDFYNYFLTLGLE